MSHPTPPRRLEADDVSVTFAGLKALRSVSLSVERGQVLGLIGPNGAGKTTLVNVLTGFAPPSSGSVKLDGEALHGLSADGFRRRGIARTFQGGRLFRALSVQDNLEVTGVGLGMTRREAAQAARETLDWMGLSHLANLTAGALPYTDERRIGIARAMIGRPAFLLLDEPAAGMSEHEANDLRDLMHRLVQEVGCGLLLIEHNVRLVLSLCDPVVVLDSGEVIERGGPDVIRASERVRHAYMGTAAETADPLHEVEEA
jgi:branched-chain amino acid transport system ATP-binding protein